MNSHNLIQCPVKIVEVFFPQKEFFGECYITTTCPELLVFNFCCFGHDMYPDRKDYALPRTACDPENLEFFDLVVLNSRHIAGAANMTLEFLAETLE